MFHQQLAYTLPKTHSEFEAFEPSKTSSNFALQLKRALAARGVRTSGAERRRRSRAARRCWKTSEMEGEGKRRGAGISAWKTGRRQRGRGDGGGTGKEVRGGEGDEIAVTTTTKKIIKMRLRGDAQIIYRYRLLEKI